MQNVSQFRDRVARVVVDLNNRLADSQSGSLIQIWMPDTLDGNIVLQTQGLPYAVTGTGDLLALFRCVSCRYHFSTDPVMQPKLLGAVGRVYTSLEPEMCNDLQKYNKQVYLRVMEAQRCRVHSTLVMPFFENSSRDKPIGVIEVVKNSKSVQFMDLVDKLTAALSRVNLYCADIDCRSVEIGLREWPLEVDVSLLDMGTPKIQDVTDAADGSGTGESLSEVSAKSRRPLLKSTRSQEADNIVSSEPEKDSAELKDDKRSSPAQPLQTQCGSTPNLTILGQAGSAPNLTTLSQTVQQDISGPDADPGAQVVGGRYNGMNYHYSPYVTPVPAGLPVNGSSVTYPNGNHFVGMSPVPTPMVPFGVPQQYANGVSPTEHCVTPIGHINNSQDFTQAMVHLQNFHNLLQELRPGPRKSKADGRKSKTSMGTGRHLTFDDLKRHMNVGLKEAAGQLGICPTTLKRACRRNGITRWPCRQLAKLNKTMSELGYKGPPPDGVLESALRGQLRTSSLSKELSSVSADSSQAASQPSKGSVLEDLETRQTVERTLSGPCSAPACLDLLGDAEGQLLGSSSSQGLLSAVLADQEYDWGTTGDDADDDIGAEEEDDKPSVSESARSAAPVCSQSSHDAETSIPFPASSANLTFMMGSREILDTKVPAGEVHRPTTVHENHTGTPHYLSDGFLSFADILKDGFDVNQLDIDADMPDLGELGQAAS